MRSDSYLRWAGGCAAVVAALFIGSVVQADEPGQRLIVKKFPGDAPGPVVWFVAADEQPQDDYRPKAEVRGDVLILRRPAGAEQRLAVKFADESSGGDDSNYWIGVMCDDTIDEALRAHLKLPPGRGVKIIKVVEDSPAAKAGLKEFDILLKVGDVPLNDVRALVEAVRDAGGQKLRIEYVAGGEQKTVVLEPAKRPKLDIAELPQFDPSRRMPRFEMLPELLRREFKMDPDGGHTVITRFARPGIVLAPDAEYPDNLEVTISKKGKAAAQIVVQRGDDRWETTADKLGELPDDVRGHVERLLGRWPMSARARLLPKADENVDFTVEIAEPDDILIEVPDGEATDEDGQRTFRRRIIRRTESAEDDAPAEDRIERRFRQMDERLQRLQGLIERLSERVQDDAADRDENEGNDKPAEPEDF